MSTKRRTQCQRCAASLLIGLAAAFVQPWGWYVLMLNYPLHLVYVPVSVFVMSGLPLGWKLIVLPLLLVMGAVSAVCFYRRRGMFGPPGAGGRANGCGLA